MSGPKKSTATTTAAQKPPVKKAKRRTRKNMKSYSHFINKVLKQVHPGAGISKKAMEVMDNLVGDMFERLAVQAKELNGIKAKATMQVYDVQQAVKLVLPGELSKHGISEGTKAYQSYVLSTGGKP